MPEKSPVDMRGQAHSRKLWEKAQTKVLLPARENQQPFFNAFFKGQIGILMWIEKTRLPILLRYKYQQGDIFW